MTRRFLALAWEGVGESVCVCVLPCRGAQIGAGQSLECRDTGHKLSTSRASACFCQVLPCAAEADDRESQGEDDMRQGVDDVDDAESDSSFRIPQVSAVSFGCFVATRSSRSSPPRKIAKQSDSS